MADWPEYDAPDGVGGVEANQDDTQSGATSTAPAEDSPQPADTPAPGDGGTTPGGVAIPKYRFDEVNEALRQEREARQAERQMLARAIEALRARDPQQQQPQQPQEQPLDEREQRIVAELDRLLRRSPVYQQLAPLIEHAEPLLQSARMSAERARAEKQHWDTVAASTMASVLEEGAKALAVKSVGELKPEQERWLRGAFADYVQLDPNRVARYERQDPSLVKEFIGAYRSGIGGVSPEARAGIARQQARGQQIRRLPTGGSATAPIGTPPPRQDNSDEDAVHGAGWKAFQDSLNASR